MSRPRILIIGLFAVLFAACGGDTDVPTAPAESVLAATNAPAAAEPTSTSPPPAVTISGLTDATPTAESATSPPTEVIDTDPLIGPDAYPPNVNPLTGLVVDDPADLQRTPLSIKISNFPRYVRPQSGLSIADMVWEHYSEGGTTRFSAIFLAGETDRVGPIRSARLIDTVLTEMVAGALVTSGSSTGTMERLARKPWFDLVISEVTGYQCPPLCHDNEDTSAVYTSTEVLWNILAEDDLNAAPAINGGLAFQNQPPANGRGANVIRVDYSGDAHSEWRYSEVANRYHRWVDVSQTELEAHLDELDGLHIAVENVVVLLVNHVVDFSIAEDFDAAGATAHFATEIQLWLTGPALVFRDGLAYDATWVRMEVEDMLSLVDEAGNPLPLHPGRTWFHLVGRTSIVSEVGTSWTFLHKSPRDFLIVPTAEVTADPEQEEATPTPEG